MPGPPAHASASDAPATPDPLPNIADRPLLKKLVKSLLRAYLRAWHGFEVYGYANLPPTGPALALTNHSSLLDVPALMATDPYPNATLVAKASLFKIPPVRYVFNAWGAIPVDRHGRDTSSIRAILGVLRAGGVVVIAVEGTRSRSGRLEPINRTLARIAVSANVPLIPVGIAGSYKALPPGAFFPRRRKIVLRLGKPFYLPRGTDEEEAVRRIRDEIAALLPPEQQPMAGAS